ncbi:hypothetical protein IG631_08280 [Alternaria alternata]|nr:hypothetical protein IG631_08280 [Alternaria alternata]
MDSYAGYLTWYAMLSFVLLPWLILSRWFTKFTDVSLVGIHTELNSYIYIQAAFYVSIQNRCYYTKAMTMSNTIVVSRFQPLVASRQFTNPPFTSNRHKASVSGESQLSLFILGTSATADLKL